MTGTDSNTFDKEILSGAISRASESVANGGGPFGAVLRGVNPANGKLYTFTANNRVTADNDPTAHAEVSVIRDACKYLKLFSLEGFTLYSSCEPCPMCLSSALWARVDGVVFAADRYDAADAGFDDLAFYEKLGIDTEELEFVRRIEHEDSLEPFNLWKSKEDRIDY